LAFADYKGRERLNFQLVEGTGPEQGWLSTSLAEIDGYRSSKMTIAVKAPSPLDEVLKPLPSGDKPLPVAIMFPGQGSQYVKMLEGVKDMPAVKDMLDKAKPILGWDVLELCLNGPEEKLEDTKYCQPCMFIGGLAGLEKLRSEQPDKVTKAAVMAGLSLGEYTALCAAGVLDFEDCLKLVKLRGEAMMEAASASKQGMLSVAGLEHSKLQPLCEQAAKKTGEVCQISNSLFPKGYSCGGSEAAVNELKDLAAKDGALQAKVLKTAGAFHTPLMQPAAEKLSAAIDDAAPRMKPNKHTIFMNFDAHPIKPGTDPAIICKNMNKQLVNTVQWEESVKGMIDAGITEYFECGPMKQMKAMMKRIDQAMWKNTTNIDV